MLRSRVYIPFSQAAGLYPLLRDIASLNDDKDVLSGSSIPFQISPEDFKKYYSQGRPLHILDTNAFSRQMSGCLTDDGKFDCMARAGALLVYEPNPLFLRELYTRLVRADYQDGRLDGVILPEYWSLPLSTEKEELTRLFEKYFGAKAPKSLKENQLFDQLAPIVEKGSLPVFPSDMFYAGPDWNPNESANVFAKFYETEIREGVNRLNGDFAKCREHYKTKYNEKKERGDLRRAKGYQDGQLAEAELKRFRRLIGRLRKNGRLEIADQLEGHLHKFTVIALRGAASSGRRLWGEVMPLVIDRIFAYVYPPIKRFVHQRSDRITTGWNIRRKHERHLCEYYQGLPMKYNGGSEIRGRAALHFRSAGRLRKLFEHQLIYRYFHYQPPYSPDIKDCTTPRPDFTSFDEFAIKVLHELDHYLENYGDKKTTLELTGLNPADLHSVSLEWSKRLEDKLEDPKISYGEKMKFAEEHYFWVSAFVLFQGAIEYTASEFSYPLPFKPGEVKTNWFGSAEEMVLKPLFREYLMRQKKKTPVDGNSNFLKDISNY